MQLTIVSWGSTDLATTTDINNGVDFSAWYDSGQVTVPERSGVYSARANRYPLLAGVQVNQNDFTFKIRCLGTFHSQRETIKKYFSPESFAVGELTFADAANSGKQWYLRGTSIRVNEESPGIMAVTLALDEPYLREVAETTGTWTITATGQSTDFVNSGNLEAKPILRITPTSGKSSDFQYFQWVGIYNTTKNTFTNFPFDFGEWDTAALVAAGKAQADGDDVRLRINGQEVYRWFGTTDRGAINTTDTAMWANIDLAPITQLTLLAAIGSTDLEFRLDPNAAGVAASIQRLKDSPVKLLKAENEIIGFEQIEELRGVVSGLTRGLRGTTAASHALGVVMDHIQLDCFRVYGSSDAAAQSVDDGRKPIIDLHSTNSTWYYTSFYDSVSPGRSAQWNPLVSRAGTGKLSTYYTGNQTANVNPGTEMGMTLKPYMSFNTWRTDNAEVNWQLYHPAGITAAQATGSKYRYSVSFAATAALQYYDDIAKAWVNADNQSSPSSDQTWESFTIASTDTGNLGGARTNVRFVLGGSIAGSSGNSNSYQIDTLTATISSSDLPQKVVGAEDSLYHLSARITNSTTGDYMDLDWLMSLNQTMVVDCNAKTITYNDQRAFAALTLSTIRDEWLPLKVGTNTLQYDETGAAGLTIDVEFENRNTL